MVYGFRYIQIDETGAITSACSMPVEGVTIDTEGMPVPEQPTDAIYELHYSEAEKLHWVKVADFEKKSTQLDRIEEQVNAIANGTTSENTDAINALLGI